MRRIKPFGLALVAMFALSAFVATAAQAASGPYWSNSAKRLGAGETSTLTATSKGPFILFQKTSNTTIECKSMKLNQGIAIGSQLGYSGTSQEVIEYKECEVMGNGASCKLTSKSITTSTLKNTLGYSSAARTGPILVLFSPVTGEVFTTIEFANNANCTVTGPEKVFGMVIGEAYVAGKVLNVGEKILTTKGELQFGTTLKTMFTESAGNLVTSKAKLELGVGGAATLTGTAVIELEGQLWSILT